MLPHQSLFFIKMNMAEQQKLHLNKSQELWNIILWRRPKWSYLATSRPVASTLVLKSDKVILIVTRAVGVYCRSFHMPVKKAMTAPSKHKAIQLLCITL